MPPPPPPPPPADTMVRKDYAAWQAMVAARAAEREARAKNKSHVAVQQQSQVEPALKRQWDCVGDRSKTLQYDRVSQGPGAYHSANPKAAKSLAKLQLMVSSLKDSLKEQGAAEDGTGREPVVSAGSPHV